MPDEPKGVKISPEVALKIAAMACVISCFNPFLGLLFLPVWPRAGSKDDSTPSRD